MSPSPDGDRSSKRRIPRWLLVVLVLLAGLAAWMQLGDPFGDEGMSNVLSFFAVAIAAVVVFVWFLCSSRFPKGIRLTGLALVLALGAAAWFTVRIKGFSGSMIPDLRWSFAADERPALTDDVPVEGLGPVDLTRTGSSDFPGYYGAQRDGRVATLLSRDWDTKPPEILWRRRVGPAWSGFAVVAGVAVTMEQRGEQEAVRAYDVETGHLRWSFSAPGNFQHALAGDGPHATPTIDAGRVYALGARGRLVCLEGADGTLIWQRDLLAEFDISIEAEDERIQYGRSNSPLIVDGLVVVPAGGDPDGHQAGLVAYDKLTGEPAWEGPPRAISHSSPTLATIAGTPQILIVNEASVSAHDPADGRLLWEHEWPGTTTADSNNSQPLVVAGDRVLVTKGYGSGAMLMAITRSEDGAFAAERLWHVKRSLRTKLTSAVVKNGFAYGLSDGILECVDLETGRRRWKDGRYGHGQLLLAGDLLLVTTEEGEVLLIEASPELENEVVGSVEVLGDKTWNTFALYGDRLLLRNAEEAASVRLPVEAE
ncbi:MAG: PQQ-binding-like beta-propeller repeat protein [bacterium]|nr:PQQ-binding-like beta-propeller repeat protein [bacterium]